MATTKKPESVEIIVRSRKKNVAKSITVYGATVEDVFKKVQKIFTTD